MLPSPLRLAVIGHPISHSLSPFIHQTFAQQFSLSLDYQKKEIAPNQLPSFMEQAEHQWHGYNLTIPHKNKAFSLCLSLGYSLTQEARKAQAINTICTQKKIAHNTDGIGLVKHLQHLSFPHHKARILILGAGGAALGIASHLTDNNLFIHNRSAHKTDLFINQLNCRPHHPDNHYDLIINTTPFGQNGVQVSLPPIHWLPTTYAYDLTYNLQQTTPFLLQAPTTHKSDGFGMLIEQAAAAFTLWATQTPNTTPLHTKNYRSSLIS